jgi:hypothetical protein
VSAQTRIPPRESFLKLPNKATGWTTAASGAVTATTSDGLSAPARTASQPAAGRKLASRVAGAEAPAGAMPSATAKAAISVSLRIAMWKLRFKCTKRSLRHPVSTAQGAGTLAQTTETLVSAGHTAGERMSRTLSLLFVSAVAFVGSSAHSSAFVTPICRTAQLRITLARTGAVTGEEGGYLRFTNKEGTVCRISGWPIAIALEPSGKKVRAGHAVHGTMLGGWSNNRPLPMMTLRRGASAYAVIEGGDNAVGYETKLCPSARWLYVSPPGDSRQVRLSAWLKNDLTFLPLCSVYVSAVVPLSVLAH